MDCEPFFGLNRQGGRLVRASLGANRFYNPPMDDWVQRAMQRWPNVPALFGWLALDRRGRWLVRGERITHPRIIATIDRNYAGDEHGRWFFQNGPQRGYMALAGAPYVLRAEGASLVTHNGLPVERISSAYIDEEGAITLATEHGPGELLGADLEWALQRLRKTGEPVDEEQLADVLAAPSGELTTLALEIEGAALPLIRLDYADAPAHLGFERDPQPHPGERTSAGAPD